MLITERSTYMESVSVALAELLLTVCKRVYSAPHTLRMMAERAKQRRILATLDDWQLDDIGLARVDVMREVDKPWWKK